jgi:hypothetical protein
MNARVTNLDGAGFPIAGQYKDLTVSSAVVQLPDLPDGSEMALVSFDGGNVRVTFGGDDPTTATGHQFTGGEKGRWSRAMIKAAKFLREGSTDGHVRMSAIQI